MTSTITLTTAGTTVEYNFPSTWEDLTVKQYSNIVKIMKDDATHNISKTISVIAQLTGVARDILLDINLTEFNEIAKRLEFLDTPLPKVEPKETINCNGVEYYIKRNLEALTVGETISLEMLIEKSEGNLLTVLPEMLCLLLKLEPNEPFKVEHMNRAKEFANLKFIDVNEVFNFFLSGEKQ